MFDVQFTLHDLLRATGGRLVGDGADFGTKFRYLFFCDVGVSTWQPCVVM